MLLTKETLRFMRIRTALGYALWHTQFFLSPLGLTLLGSLLLLGVVVHSTVALSHREDRRDRSEEIRKRADREVRQRLEARVTALKASLEAADLRQLSMERKLQDEDGWIRRLSSDLTTHVVDPLPECMEALRKQRVKKKGVPR